MYEYHHRWKAVLGKQIGLYEQAQMGAEQREAEKQLAIVEEKERQSQRRAEEKTAPAKADAGVHGANGTGAHVIASAGAEDSGVRT
jgi:hypothetical protein